MIVTEKQLQVLENLAIYRYLTAQQLHTLGIYKSIPVIRNKALAPLKKKPLNLIKGLNFGFYPTKGKLQTIHHLTKKGVNTLKEIEGYDETIIYPKGKVEFTRDYFHRVSFIDIHIALRQWVENKGEELVFFHSYFDSAQGKRGFHLIRDTQVTLNEKTIVPDGNFCLQMQDGEKRLFSLELHRGNNIKVILKQLFQHRQIIEQGLLSHKYSHNYDNYVLSVYEDIHTMERVKKEFLSNTHFSDYKDYFIFSSLDALIADFSSSWFYANNKEFSIFQSWFSLKIFCY